MIPKPMKKDNIIFSVSGALSQGCAVQHLEKSFARMTTLSFLLDNLM